MHKKIINIIFSNTRLFEKFRDILHNRFVEEKKILRRELSPKKKTLDFGCGVGQYSMLFDKKYYFGVDIEESNINFAKKKFDRNFQLIQNTEELKNNKFDQIFCTKTLHHINDEDLKDIFRNLFKILKKGGRFLIEDHVNVKSQPNFIGRFMLKSDRGRHTRNIDELKNFLNTSFKIEKQYYFKTGPYKNYVLILRKK